MGGRERYGQWAGQDEVKRGVKGRSGGVSLKARTEWLRYD